VRGVDQRPALPKRAPLVVIRHARRRVARGSMLDLDLFVRCFRHPEVRANGPGLKWPAR
jgi:hypothetical protein